MEEYEYCWDREFAITRVVQSVVGWASIFAIPGAVAWMILLNKPNGEVQAGVGYLGLVALCAALHSRKYWKRLSEREPQLEFRRNYLRAAQLGEQVIPWVEVLQLRGQEETIHRDVATLMLETVRGNVTLNIAGLNAPMRTIIDQAQTVAVAAHARDEA